MKSRLLAILCLVLLLSLGFFNREILANSTTNSWQIFRETATGADLNKLKFFWYPTGAPSAPTMTFDTLGQVGIGTTSPAAKLDVMGGTSIFRHSTSTNTYHLAILGSGDVPYLQGRKNLANEPRSFAMQMDGGNVGIGTTNFGMSSSSTGPVLAIANSGTTPNAVGGQGILYVSSGALKYRGPNNTTTLGNADYAESMPSTELVEDGDVISISSVTSYDSDLYNRFYVQKSSQAYDQRIVGIVSLSNKEHPDKSEPMVGLVGRVPTKVSAENGSIKKGDYLTSSSTPGVAMKATRPGQMVGKALEDFDGSGQGRILVMVNVSHGDPTAGDQASNVQNQINKQAEEIKFLKQELEDLKQLIVR